MITLTRLLAVAALATFILAVTGYCSLVPTVFCLVAADLVRSFPA